MQRADMAVLALSESSDEQNHRHNDHTNSGARIGDIAQFLHQTHACLARFSGARDKAVIDFEIAGQNRQHDQIGKNFQRHADGGRDGQFLNHLNGDEDQCAETDQIGNQSHGTRYQ